MSAPLIPLPNGAGALKPFTQSNVSRLPTSGIGGTGNASAAAEQFESMAIAQMLKPMFATMGKAAAPFGGGQIERSFRPFLINAIARSMEARGGLGLAPAVEAALSAKHADQVPGAGPATGPAAPTPTPTLQTQAGKAR